MFATPVPPWFGRRGIHFSWVVMGIAFLTMLTSSAALGLPGAFLQPLGKEFGWWPHPHPRAHAPRLGRAGPARRLPAAARQGVRLEHRPDLRRDRPALRAVRADRAVRRGAD